jgi:3-oxoacyl-[acyl-carrier-protein] synthase III
VDRQCRFGHHAVSIERVNPVHQPVPITVPTARSQSNLSGRSRVGQTLGVRIAGSGSYVPDLIVTNDDLARLGCDSQWILQRTGILERRHALPHQATSDLAAIAAKRCLDDAAVQPRDVDLLIVATITPDHTTPSTACHLQRQFDIIAPSMDLGAACAGFVYALITASQFVRSGNAKRALVVGADLMSRTIDPNDKKTYPLFGDGAGAVLLVPDDDRGSGLVGHTLGAEGCGGDLLCIPAGGSRTPLTPDAYQAGQQYLRMDGRQVFKWAVRVLADSTRDVLQFAGLTSDQLDAVILHQANRRILDAAIGDLNINPERLIVNLDRYGNTSAASVPIALDEALHSGRYRRGDHLLLSGFGAGLAWGTAIVRY